VQAAAPVTQSVAPLTQPVTKAVSPVTQTVAPVARPASSVAQPVSSTVAPVTRPAADVVPMTGVAVAPVVDLRGSAKDQPAATANQPTVASSLATPAAHHVSVAPVSSSFGDTVVSRARRLAAPGLGHATVAVVASVVSALMTATGSLAGHAPRVACGSHCRTAPHSPSPASVQPPQVPATPFAGTGASAGAGLGGLSLFLFGVLFVTLGVALPRWVRRRDGLVSGWPAPFIALSVSPD
jgi:hypothetical protein